MVPLVPPSAQVLRGSGGVGGSGSVREGEVELVLPDKGSLYLKDGRLALEFYQSEAVITSVDPDAPTLRACCFVGDVVLAVNGAPIDAVATLHKLLQAHTSGEPVRMPRRLHFAAPPPSTLPRSSSRRQGRCGYAYGSRRCSGRCVPSMSLASARVRASGTSACASARGSRSARPKASWPPA